jgi:hypothetical protein
VRRERRARQGQIGDEFVEHGVVSTPTLRYRGSTRWESVRCR